MTTPLDHEPLPGDGTVPFMSTLVHRLYHRLPEVFRTMDALDLTWTFKRYLGGMLSPAADIDTIIVALTGDQPVGPPTPEPWGLPADELETWRGNRVTRPSALGDPDQANAAWLPWLAQMVGARLDPGATEEEKRDTIRFATSGWRAGTRGAIIDAARSALTGTRNAQLYPHTAVDPSLGLIAGTPWDLTIVTRSSETPDPNAVLGAVLRKGVKPAGVVLYHRAYEASWDTWEAVYPTWADFDAATWDERQEAGLTYQSIAGNLIANPSFEVNTTSWVQRGSISTLTRQVGGVDGAGHARLTVTADGTGEFESALFALTPGNYQVGLSLRTSAGSTMQMFVQYRDAGNATLSEQGLFIGATTAGQWQRTVLPFTAPANTASALIYIQGLSMTTGQYFDVDAVVVRSA